MSLFRSPAIVSFMVIFLSACNNFDNASGVVVVDLNAVINATGQADTIKQKIEQTDAELNRQLAQAASQLEKQLADEKSKLGESPTDEQLKQLDQLTLQANQQLQQAQLLARQQSQQNRLTLVKDLRQKVKPVAQEIARTKGATIVLESTENLIWFDSTVDITDEVIAEFRSMSSGTIQPDSPGDGGNIQSEPAKAQ